MQFFFEIYTHKYFCLVFILVLRNEICVLYDSLLLCIDLIWVYINKLKMPSLLINQEFYLKLFLFTIWDKYVVIRLELSLFSSLKSRKILAAIIKSN